MPDILERANIPKHATVAFEGIRCRIYQWPQTLYDGSVGTFEKIMRMPAATVIAIVDGKILLQEQEQPHLKTAFLSLPGGHADSWDEPLLDVGKRELLEEAGLASDDWELFVDLTQVNFTIFEHHLYVARNCRKAAEPHFDRGERITGRFVTPEELRAIKEDPRWRHADTTAYLNKPGNFDKLVSLIRK